jgi:hypothetical protein
LARTEHRIDQCGAAGYKGNAFAPWGGDVIDDALVTTSIKSATLGGQHSKTQRLTYKQTHEKDWGGNLGFFI